MASSYCVGEGTGSRVTERRHAGSDRRGAPGGGAVRAGDGARVDEPAALVFVDPVLVGVPGDEDVDIQLPLQRRQRLLVAPGHHLVAVGEADLELAHLHHLGLGKLLRVLRCGPGGVRRRAMRARGRLAAAQPGGTAPERASTSSKSPRVTCTLGASVFKWSSCSLVHMFPVQNTCCILLGTWVARGGVTRGRALAPDRARVVRTGPKSGRTSIFLNFSGMSAARWGMCMSPRTRTSCDNPEGGAAVRPTRRARRPSPTTPGRAPRRTRTLPWRGRAGAVWPEAGRGARIPQSGIPSDHTAAPGPCT